MAVITNPATPAFQMTIVYKNASGQIIGSKPVTAGDPEANALIKDVGVLTALCKKVLSTNGRDPATIPPIVRITSQGVQLQGMSDDQIITFARLQQAVDSSSQTVRAHAEASHQEALTQLATNLNLTRRSSDRTPAVSARAPAVEVTPDDIEFLDIADDIQRISFKIRDPAHTWTPYRFKAENITVFDERTRRRQDTRRAERSGPQPAIQLEPVDAGQRLVAGNRGLSEVREPALQEQEQQQPPHFDAAVRTPRPRSVSQHVTQPLRNLVSFISPVVTTPWGWMRGAASGAVGLVSGAASRLCGRRHGDDAQEDADIENDDGQQDHLDAHLEIQLPPSPRSDEEPVREEERPADGDASAGSEHSDASANSEPSAERQPAASAEPQIQEVRPVESAPISAPLQIAERPVFNLSSSLHEACSPEDAAIFANRNALADSAAFPRYFQALLQTHVKRLRTEEEIAQFHRALKRRDNGTFERPNMAVTLISKLLVEEMMTSSLPITEQNCPFPTFRTLFKSLNIGWKLPQGGLTPEQKNLLRRSLYQTVELPSNQPNFIAIRARAQNLMTELSMENLAAFTTHCQAAAQAIADLAPAVQPVAQAEPQAEEAPAIPAVQAPGAAQLLENANRGPFANRANLSHHLADLIRAHSHRLNAEELETLKIAVKTSADGQLLTPGAKFVLARLLVEDSITSNFNIDDQAFTLPEKQALKALRARFRQLGSLGNGEQLQLEIRMGLYSENATTASICRLRKDAIGLFRQIANSEGFDQVCAAACHRYNIQNSPVAQVVVLPRLQETGTEDQRAETLRTLANRNPLPLYIQHLVSAHARRLSADEQIRLYALIKTRTDAEGVTELENPAGAQVLLAKLLVEEVMSSEVNIFENPQDVSSPAKFFREFKNENEERNEVATNMQTLQLRYRALSPQDQVALRARLIKGEGIVLSEQAQSVFDKALPIVARIANTDKFKGACKNGCKQFNILASRQQAAAVQAPQRASRSTPVKLVEANTPIRILQDRLSRVPTPIDTEALQAAIAGNLVEVNGHRREVTTDDILTEFDKVFEREISEGRAPKITYSSQGRATTVSRKIFLEGLVYYVNHPEEIPTSQVNGGYSEEYRRMFAAESALYIKNIVLLLKNPQVPLDRKKTVLIELAEAGYNPNDARAGKGICAPGKLDAIHAQFEYLQIPPASQENIGRGDVQVGNPHSRTEELILRQDQALKEALLFERFKYPEVHGPSMMNWIRKTAGRQLGLNTYKGSSDDRWANAYSPRDQLGKTTEGITGAFSIIYSEQPIAGKAKASALLADRINQLTQVEVAEVAREIDSFLEDALLQGRIASRDELNRLRALYVTVVDNAGSAAQTIAITPLGINFLKVNYGDCEIESS